MAEETITDQQAIEILKNLAFERRAFVALGALITKGMEAKDILGNFEKLKRDAGLEVVIANKGVDAARDQLNAAKADTALAQKVLGETVAKTKLQISEIEKLKRDAEDALSALRAKGSTEKSALDAEIKTKQEELRKIQQDFDAFKAKHW